MIPGPVAWAKTPLTALPINTSIGTEVGLTMMGGLVTGTLKGYDALMNLVLDEVQEVMRGMLFL